MENKDSTDPVNRKMKAVYDLVADFTFEFENGDTIRVSKAFLAYHTDFLSDLLFGPTSASNFKVKDFDSETFKSFLDCLFGLKEYSVLDALLIYPIAHEYQVKESVEKCVEVLKPKIMDENVPIILNLALFYKNDEVLNDVIGFVKEEIGVVGFIDNEAYRDSLQPASMRRLMEEIQLNSFVWEIIYEWGRNYLQKQCKAIDIRSFFEEIDIFSKLELIHLESDKTLFDFFEMGLLDSEQILLYSRSKILIPATKLPDESIWSRIDDESFTETIVFCHPYGFSSNKSVKIKISTNKVFFESFNLNKEPALGADIKYSFRIISAEYKKLITHNFHGRNCAHYGHDMRSCVSYCNLNFQNCICFIPVEISSSRDSKVFETDLDMSPGELFFEVDVEKLPNNFQEIESVNITYSFANTVQGRFLTTTLNGRFKNANALYFTKDVVVHCQ